MGNRSSTKLSVPSTRWILVAFTAAWLSGVVLGQATKALLSM